MWDFTLGCPRKLKMQIFTVLKAVIHTYERDAKREAAGTAKVLSICVKHQVTDIETMTLSEEQQFEQELAESLKGERNVLYLAS